MAKKAIIYCRTATESNKSIVHQSNICSKYAQKKNYQILDIIFETGSGMRINDNLMDCIKKVINGSVDVLISTEPTRLARESRLFLKIRELLGEKLELSNSSGAKNPFHRDLMDSIFVSISEYRTNLSVKKKGGKKQ